jgi:predicted metal-dependent enzyme (double-stranded beta helix superfamily)
MAYELATFCKDANLSLKAKPLAAALEDIAANLRKLLVNADFVAATFSDAMPAGKRELYHDSETDFYVMAHVQAEGKTGKPHSHGNSWAIYGNARGFTEMTEWRRVNGADEEAHVLEQSDKYKLGAGQSRAYGPGVIHSTGHPEKAWVIRITGTDLDHLPRYHFNKNRDQILEKA